MLNSILSDRDTLLDKGFTPGLRVDLDKIEDFKGSPDQNHFSLEINAGKVGSDIGRP